MSKEITLQINNYPVRIDLAQGLTKPKVACLGPMGTYTEEARYELLKDYLAGMDADFLDGNPKVVQQVESGEYDLGIVPVENAIGGDVPDVLTELNHIRNVTILGEEILGIQHVLMGQLEEQIETIYSHPQGFAQCRKYLLKNYPEVKQEEVKSTALAAELVKDNQYTLAIASKRAAQLNHLPIIAEGIGDVKGNSTRFLMLGRGETQPTGQDSTAMIFIPTGDRPGILARCLTTLASYGINLTKIDSRPTGSMREYAFWVTMDGHFRDDMVKRGIEDLRDTYCKSLRILGSYRKATLPEGVKDPGAINGG